MTNENTEGKEIAKKEDFELTDRNWLMLKEIEKGHKVKDAYRLAGYKGKDNAAYVLYWKLKAKLEQVYESDNVDSLRLKMAAKKILDMPVRDEPVKPEVKLKAIETLHKLQERTKTSEKAISPFVVFKADNVEISQSESKRKEPSEPVIDVEEVGKEQNNAEG